MTSTKWIELGYVARAHGVRGELRLETSGSVDLPDNLTVLRLHKGAATLDITPKVVRGVHDAWLVTCAEIDQREAAERWKGATVLVPEALIPKPAAGEYYLYELTGAQVIDEAGAALGTVRRVLDNAGQQLLELEYEGVERLLPLVPETFVRFDRGTGTLCVRPIAGLWE